MLSIEEGTQSVRYARSVIEQYIAHQTAAEIKLGAAFQKNQGVFVTLHTFPAYDLRGCIGLPLPILPLKDAIREAAQSATQDPRFPPLNKTELGNIIIEVTVLTQPLEIKVKTPKEYFKHIQIGRDGLIVRQGHRTGLLLPQVPVEQQWNVEDFLSHACMKAGLPPDAWFDEQTHISKFSGQIFTEITPMGEIKEKQLDGSDN